MSNILPEVKKQITKQLGTDITNLIAPDVDKVGEAVALGKKATGEDESVKNVKEGKVEVRPRPKRKPTKHPFKTITKGFKYKLNNDLGVGGQVLQFQRFKPKKKYPTEMELVQQGTTPRAVILMLVDVLENHKFKGLHAREQSNNKIVDGVISKLNSCIRDLNAIS